MILLCYWSAIALLFERKWSDIAIWSRIPAIRQAESDLTLLFRTLFLLSACGWSVLGLAGIVTMANPMSVFFRWWLFAARRTSVGEVHFPRTIPRFPQRFLYGTFYTLILSAHTRNVNTKYLHLLSWILLSTQMICLVPWPITIIHGVIGELMIPCCIIV